MRGEVCSVLQGTLLPVIFQLNPVLVALTLRYLPLLPIIEVHRNHLADNFINSDPEISQSNKILVKCGLIADAALARGWC